MNIDINITENASKQIFELQDSNRKTGEYFRIKVDGGGCAGFQYNFIFTNKKDNNDLILKKDNVTVLIDDISYNLVKGSTIDYVTELIGSSFKIINPQATSSCGCGTSFSI